MAPEINLVDFFGAYKALPHQKEAVQLLQSSASADLLKNSAAWVLKYRETPPAPAISNPLEVQYFWQQDNGPEGWRQCQTSSIAMALNYLQTPGIDDDLDYLRIVRTYGDTTEQATHTKALSHLKVDARFATNLHKSDVMNQIDHGKPLPCGILHHGSANSPTGGGHYICVIGYDDTAVICHDPYGELDMTSGTWAATGQQDGKFVHYSWTNFLKRWDVNGGGGWAWLF